MKTKENKTNLNEIKKIFEAEGYQVTRSKKDGCKFKIHKEEARFVTRHLMAEAMADVNSGVYNSQCCITLEDLNI